MRASILFSALALAALTGPTLAGTVVFKDDFSSASSGWDDNSEATMRGKTRGMGIYTDGKFQMTPLEDNTMGLLPSPRQATTGNVRLESETFLYVSTGSGGAGLFCRASDRDNFYAFLVTGAGEWRIVKSRGGKGETLAGGRLPKQVVDGMVDGKIGASCAGETLSLSFKGKTMGSARDATFSAGNSGLMIIGSDLASTYATYDDFLLEAL